MFRHSFKRLCMCIPSANAFSYAAKNSVNCGIIKRGIKKIPNKARRKDGHHVSLRNVFWEERAKTVPKPPLWIEPSSATGNVLASKSSRRNFTMVEKRYVRTSPFYSKATNHVTHIQINISTCRSVIITHHVGAG